MESCSATAIAVTNNPVWLDFVARYRLNNVQQGQFKNYIELLLVWNELFNITTIITPEDIIRTHFQDSLALVDHYSMKKDMTVADVGSGGGFPGIPLAIYFPHITVILIEVHQKKNMFLKEVISALGLLHVQICSMDWRTFLRKSTVPVDLFCARASLSPVELVRVFKPSTQYHDATVVYFASSQWKIGTKEQIFFDHEYTYTVGTKKKTGFF